MSRVLLAALLVPALHAQSKNELPDTPGRSLVIRVCTKCHGTEMFAAIRMTREEWKYEVDGMIARGARASRQDARRIVDYLAKNLGPAAPARK
jgi:hypothetical protein